jgi:hypothetical protein
MLSTTQIVERMNLKRSNTDLGLIYDIWADGLDIEAAIRSSDQIAIRKAVAALDRVADMLKHSVTNPKGATHRTLPEITPSTRIRKIPERFWLEIVDESALDVRHADRAVVFVEFSPIQLKLGVRLQSSADIGDADEVSQFEFLETLDIEDFSNWNVEQTRPPADGRACSNNLNAWLSGRANAKQKDDFFPTVSKIYTLDQRSLENLVEGVEQASALCEKINAKVQPVSQTILQDHGSAFMA